MSTTESTTKTTKTAAKPELVTVPDPGGPIDVTEEGYDPIDEYGVEAIISGTEAPEPPEPPEPVEGFDPDEENGAESAEAQAAALQLGTEA